MTCSITSTPTLTSSTSSMIISVTPRSFLPFNTTLTLTSNVYWPSNAQDTQPILEEPISCLPITNSSNTIECAYTRTTSSIIVTITNLVDQDSVGPIEFSISNIINPPTTEPQGSISISSKKDGSKAMERCSGNKINGITANSLSSVTYTVENRGVNAVSKGYLEFTVNTLVQNSDDIIITFPP